MTDATNYTQLHAVDEIVNGSVKSSDYPQDRTNSTPALAPESIPETAIESMTESIVRRNIFQELPDEAAILQDFLIHYAAFMGITPEDGMAWQAPFLPRDEPTVMKGRIGFKVGVAGVAGLATIAAGGALLPKDAIQALAETQKKPISRLVHRLSPQSSRPVTQTKLNAIAPVESLSTPPQTLPTVSGLPPKLRVGEIISPAIRAPLPGQALIHQSQSALPPSFNSALASPQTMPLPEWATTKVTVKKGAPPTPPVAAPAPTPDPALTPGLVQPGSLLSDRANPLSPQLSGQAETPVSPPARSPQLRVSPAESLPNSSKLRSTDSSPQTSAPANPAQPAMVAPPTALSAPLKFVNPVQPVVAQAMVDSAKIGAVLSPRPMSSAQGPETIASSKETKQLSAKSQEKTVVLANASLELKQAITTAQTLPDFLKLSAQMPANAPVAVLSLTPEAALAVPNAPELQKFQVFRLQANLYQTAWQSLTQVAGQPPALPAHGFIDYQNQAIVLPALSI
jgi:hypothetical protein